MSQVRKWLCPDAFCSLIVDGDEKAPFGEDSCMAHNKKLFLKYEEVPPVAPLAAPRRVGDMMAFLATDRSMGNLSAMQRIMDAPQSRELWNNETFRNLIAGEWDVLKGLMEQAGFE